MRKLLVLLAARVESCCSKQVFFFYLLTFQNAAAVLLMSYSQQRQLAANAERFAVTHVVLMQELTKVFVSLVWCAIDVGRFVRKRAIGMNEKKTSHGFYDEMQSRPAEVKIGKDPFTLSHLGSSDDSNGIDELVNASFQEHKLTAAEWWRLFRQGFVSELTHPSALRMLLPALLYGFQNCCMYVALGNIEPTLFQVTYQSRIIITALLMLCFLNRTFSARQWVSLVVLAFGVSVAQVGNNPSPGAKRPSEGAFRGDYALGIAATALTAVLSSATSVLMEAFLKSQSTSMNSFTSTKNVHLALYSVVCFAILQALNGGANDFAGARDASIADAIRGYFRGFDWLVWVLVMVQAIGGMLVAVVIKYSDNIVRTFASVLSIALGGLCSSYLYAFLPSATFLVGNTAAIGAIVMYNC